MGFGFSGVIYSQNRTNMSPDIQDLIQKKRAFNKEFGFGFRIQIFYGEETKARNEQNKFKSIVLF